MERALDLLQPIPTMLEYWTPGRFIYRLEIILNVRCFNYFTYKKHDFNAIQSFENNIDN